jgi:hypothetical protein
MKRKMTALQKKYFGKGHHSCNPRKKVSALAKTRTRYRTKYARRSHHSGGRMGGMKSFIAPLAGGAGDALISKYIPIMGIGSTVAGFALGDHVTRQIGLNRIGFSAAQYFLGGTSGTQGGLL